MVTNHRIDLGLPPRINISIGVSKVGGNNHYPNINRYAEVDTASSQINKEK